MILIIISSNLLVAIFLYGIMRENAMRQARDMRQNLMESNLTMMQQYFEDVDRIADAIIYNRDMIRFMRNDKDTVSDLALLRGIESQYYYSLRIAHVEKMLTLKIRTQEKPENFY